VRVDDQMVNLCGIAIRFNTNAIQNKDLWIVAKKTLQIESHFFFGGTARAGKFIVGLERVEFFENHDRIQKDFNLWILPPQWISAY